MKSPQAINTDYVPERRLRAFWTVPTLKICLEPLQETLLFQRRTSSVQALSSVIKLKKKIFKKYSKYYKKSTVFGCNFTRYLRSLRRTPNVRYGYPDSAQYPQQSAENSKNLAIITYGPAKIECFFASSSPNTYYQIQSRCFHLRKSSVYKSNWMKIIQS